MMKKTKKIELAFCAGLLCAALTAGTLYAAGSDAADLRGDTVEYSMKTGVIKASGNVVLHRGDITARGGQASYNTKTEEGLVTGGVIVDKGNLHMSANQVRTDGREHLIAEGSVEGSKEDKSFSGTQAEYFADRQYLLMPAGGVLRTQDGTFTADHMEGWLQENHFKGMGSAHIVSPPRHLEAGGDEAEYFGRENGRVLLTGNAWAIQEDNTLKSNRLTLYLAEDGNAKAEE